MPVEVNACCHVENSDGELICTCDANRWVLEGESVETNVSERIVNVANGCASSAFDVRNGQGGQFFLNEGQQLIRHVLFVCRGFHVFVNARRFF